MCVSTPGRGVVPAGEREGRVPAPVGAGTRPSAVHRPAVHQLLGVGAGVAAGVVASGAGLAAGAGAGVSAAILASASMARCRAAVSFFCSSP